MRASGILSLGAVLLAVAGCAPQQPAPVVTVTTHVTTSPAPSPTPSETAFRSSGKEALNQAGENGRFWGSWYNVKSGRGAPALAKCEAKEDMPPRYARDEEFMWVNMCKFAANINPNDPPE